MKPAIGYLGLGLMGGAMTRHLVAQGYSVTGFDPVAEKRASARSHGVRVVNHARDVVAGADLILLNLPTTEALIDAVFGADGLAGVLQPPQLIIDFSTITVDAARTAAERLLAETGCGWVDAPVSGGPPAAGTGSLTVMAGGRDSDLERMFALFPRLKDRIQQRGGTLSGGEQQMLAIARALMARPKLLLLDEPSLGLAPMIVKQIFDAIRDLNKNEGLSVFLVEQNAFHALRLAHRGYVMVNGVITLSGTGKELLANPQVRAAYLEGGHH